MLGNTKVRPEAKQVWLRCLPAVALALVVSGTAGAGELLVLKSTAPGLMPGDVAAAGAPIEVPRETSVTLVAGSGGVLRIEGPWSGRIDTPAPEAQGVISKLAALFGAPEPTARMGVTRSVLDACVPVELGVDEDVCVEPSGCLTLRSPVTSGKFVLDAPDGSMIQLERTAGNDAWRWPAAVPVESGDYLVWTEQMADTRSFELHVRPELGGSVEDIAWMSEAGCTAQARAALDRLAE